MIKSPLLLLRLKPMSTKGDRSQKDKSAPKRAPPAPGPFTGRVLRVAPGVRSHPRPLLKGRGLPGPPGARAAAGPGVLWTAVLIKDPTCRVLRPQLRAQPASGRGREGGQWAESRGSGSSRGAGGCGVDLAPSCIVSTSLSYKHVFLLGGERWFKITFGIDSCFAHSLARVHITTSS